MAQIAKTSRFVQALRRDPNYREIHSVFPNSANVRRGMAAGRTNSVRSFLIVATRIATPTLISASEPIVAFINERQSSRLSSEEPVRRGVSAPPDAKTRTWIYQAKNSPDSELLQKARRGDRSAFGELAELCRASLLRVARRILRDESEAQDSVQDSLLSAFVNLSRFDGRSAFLTWATRITINCCLMKLRSRRKYYEKSVDVEVDDDRDRGIACAALNPEEAAAKHEEKTMLHSAIDALPKSLRVVVEMKEIQDRTMHETASLLGISVPATKARLFRARHLLKSALASTGSLGDAQAKNRGSNWCGRNLQPIVVGARAANS